ncbi:MAG: hypothetical protein ACRDA4_07205 [Filifactoraceae bacterium]
MSKHIKIGFIMALIVLILSVGMLNAPSREALLRVGVSDDTSTLVINYMMEDSNNVKLDVKDFIQKYKISDC